jgi:uncharacterized protein (TIGR02284 family)
MNSPSAIDTVNGLLQILEDGKEGFRKAAEAVRDPNLRILFTEYSNERAEMTEELQAFTPAEHQRPTLGGTVHRGWIELKAALTSGDEHAILSECERGEDYAIEAFRDALSQDLPEGVRETIKSQSVRILEAHNKIRELRDAAHAGS